MTASDTTVTTYLDVAKIIFGKIYLHVELKVEMRIIRIRIRLITKRTDLGNYYSVLAGFSEKLV